MEREGGLGVSFHALCILSLNLFPTFPDFALYCRGTDLGNHVREAPLQMASS